MVTLKDVVGSLLIISLPCLGMFGPFFAVYHANVQKGNFDGKKVTSRPGLCSLYVEDEISGEEMKIVGFNKACQENRRKICLSSQNFSKCYNDPEMLRKAEEQFGFYKGLLDEQSQKKEQDELSAKKVGGLEILSHLQGGN